MENLKTKKDEGTPRIFQQAARRTYDVPTLTPSGNIPKITGGPEGGTLDGLFGGTGGFQEATS